MSYQGCNPLHLAVKANSRAPCYPALLDCFIRAASRHGELDRRIASGMTPLMVAASTANRLAVEGLIQWHAGDLQNALLLNTAACAFAIAFTVALLCRVLMHNCACVCSSYTDLDCHTVKGAVEVTALDLACATRNHPVIQLLRGAGARGLCEPGSDGRGFKRRECGLDPSVVSLSCTITHCDRNVCVFGLMPAGGRPCGQRNIMDHHTLWAHTYTLVHIVRIVCIWPCAWSSRWPCAWPRAEGLVPGGHEHASSVRQTHTQVPVLSMRVVSE